MEVSKQGRKPKGDGKMTQELQGMKEVIVEEILKRGLTTVKKGYDFEVYTYNNSAIEAIDEDINIPFIKGLVLNMTEVYHGNGNDRNRSYDLRIEKWDRFCGTMIERIKLYERYSVKKIQKDVNAIIDRFIEKVNEK